MPPLRTLLFAPAISLQSSCAPRRLGWLARCNGQGVLLQTCWARTLTDRILERVALDMVLASYALKHMVCRRWAFHAGLWNSEFPKGCKEQISMVEL